MGISQARVSQIEHGRIGGLDILRSCVVALGGTLDGVADFGDHTVSFPVATLRPPRGWGSSVVAAG